MRLPLFVALWLCSLSLAAKAQDRFEIQVYDAEVAEAGHPGLELHLNYVAQGRTQPSPEGELPTQHTLHTTLEPHLGVFGWGELGGYLQGALQPDGSYRYAGVKLRFKARWPERLLGEALGLAVNFELSRIPAAYEANVWGSEVRPVLDLRVDRFYAALNPIVTVDLQGGNAGHPQLEPALKLAFFPRPEISFGAEYLAALGPVDALLPAAAQSHRLFAALDFASDYFDFNLGVGHGFGSAEPWVAKAIIGIHPPNTPPSHTPPPETAPQ